MILLGYIRVSKVGGREGDSFISPTVQREKIEQWCKLHGHELLDVLTDLDESGGKTDRPEFQRALARIESGEAQGVVVAKLDRFARSIAGAADTIRRLDAAGAILASVAENIDSGPGGRLMRSILFAFAEFERERIIEGWQVARSHAVARGVHTARSAPAGYTKGADGRLVLDPDAAPAILSAFEARGKGTPWAEVARRLTASGVMPSQGAQAWLTSTVQHVIRSRTYLGELIDGDLVNPAAHEPLVSRAVWEAANAARSSSTPRSPRGEGHMLAGLIRCSGCRMVMGGGWGRAKRGSDERYSRYACKGTYAGGRCQVCATVAGAAVEQHVVAAFMARHATLTMAPSVDTSPHLEAAVADAEHELRAYVKVMRAADPGYRDGYDARVADVDAARRALGAVPAAPVLSRTALAEHWQTATVAERRELLAADIAAVFVRKGDGRGRWQDIAERVRIVWQGEPVELPKRGRGARTDGLTPYEWGDAAESAAA